MSDTARPSGTIGEIAKPPFAVLPDPTTLFLRRSNRLAALATGSVLSPYLGFLARVCEGQHAIQSNLPAVSGPASASVDQALVHGMPAFSRTLLDVDAVVDRTVDSLLAWLHDGPLPPIAAAAVESLRVCTAAERRRWVSNVLKDAVPPDDIPRHGIVAAGLQVHLARLAAKLNAEDLSLVADAVCPACGSTPMTSSIVGWRNALNTRYCNCSMCGTKWNVVRVKCLSCGATDGITYRMIEGEAGTIKAETCDTCRSYVKVLYQVHDPDLEELADDIASLGLDMLMGENGLKRVGHNIFLVGY